MTRENKRAWTIRAYPHGIYRIPEFLENRMAATGWPLTGDLSGLNRDAIRERLRQTYYQSASPQKLGQITGIVDRFVNQIQVGDAVVIPDGELTYFGIVTSPYSFKGDLESDTEGYPHWIGLDFKFDGKPLPRLELPAILFDSLKGRQTVFELPADAVWDVINHPKRYASVDPGAEQIIQDQYRQDLALGKVPGINSPRFEEAVLKVLSFYYPGLVRLSTTNAPAGVDTDLKTSLPGGLVLRVQVKCYQDDVGPLSPEAVTQLRGSMEPGEHGILVTTGDISDDAQREADSEPEKPVGLISGSEFADLVFENLERLSDSNLWALGLRRALSTR